MASVSSGALSGGAGIVIIGRVTDALAGAVAAGHVIDCVTHATGGNFSGFPTVASPPAKRGRSCPPV